MLHPHAKILLQTMVEKRVPLLHTLSAQDARVSYASRVTLTQPKPPEVASLRTVQAEGPAGRIPMRVYRPLGSAADALLPVLVYYHGGGWVIGDLDTHDTACRELANGSGCAVVSVDYRLAPEHPFPAAVDDAIGATCWVSRHARELGVDATRLAVGGDSAGGNLAAVVAIAARDNVAGTDDLNIAFQLLIYPATDQRRLMTSHARNGEGYLLTRDTIRYFHDLYLGDDSQDTDWRCSPLLHKSLANLPPALVLTAGYDPLCDEGMAYAQRLTEEGTRATQVGFERQIHGFFLMGGVLDEANTAMSLCCAELKRALRA